MTKHRWKTSPLGILLKAKKEKSCIEPNTNYKEVTVALWGKGTRLRGLVEGSTIESTTRYIANEGDFIISKIDARHGAYGFIPRELNGSIVTSDFPLYNVACESLHPRWLYWCSKSRWFIEECKNASQGTTNRVRMKIPLFEKIEIPLPIFEEQERIVKHLDAIETRLKKIQKLRKEVEKEKSALKKSLFKTLCKGSVYVVMSKIAPQVKRQINIDLDTVYQEYGIKSFYKGIFYRRSQLGSQYDWQKLFTLQEGDLVFSNIMAWEKSIGLATSVQAGWVGNHRMLTCEPNRQIALPSWIYQYFQTEEGFQKILEASPGTVARNRTLRAENLMKIEVPIPSLKIQYSFQELSVKIDKSINCNIDINFDVECLIPSLLDKIFDAK